MNTPKLLPCPSCNRQPIIGIRQVICSCGMQTMEYPSELIAVTVWNRRDSP